MVSLVPGRGNPKHSLLAPWPELKHWRQEKQISPIIPLPVVWERVVYSIVVILGLSLLSLVALRLWDEHVERIWGATVGFS